MPKYLTQAQIDHYERDGFVFPVDVFTPDEAAELRARLAAIEAEDPEAVSGRNRNNAHLAYGVFDDIVHHPKMADAVEDLIGPDILALSSIVFAKDANSPGFVSWHQDGTYAAMSDASPVTAWVALTDSTVENGAMRFLPGSHRSDGYLHHADTYGEDNILTRGQSIEDIDEGLAVPVTLKAGQVSFHHWKVAHASGPNTTDHRRVGFAIQAYIRPSVQQLKGRGFVQQVRGRDPERNMEHVPRVGDLSRDDALALRQRINDQWLDQLYDGATQRRGF